MSCWPRTMGPSVGCWGPSGSSHTEERVVSGKRADVLLGWAFMVGWGWGGALTFVLKAKPANAGAGVKPPQAS